MSNKRIDIHIFYEAAVILTLRVRSLDKVSGVKERIGEKTNLDPREIDLEYNGKTLHDSLKLDHCGIVDDGSSLILTIIEPLLDKAALEQDPYQSPYASTSGLPKSSVSETPLRSLSEKQNVVIHESLNDPTNSQDNAEASFIDPRTHYPSPGVSSDNNEDTKNTTHMVPERLTAGIAMGLRLHAAHMLSLALQEFNDASQVILTHGDDSSAHARVSMAEDRLKEEINRMNVVLHERNPNQQANGTIQRH